MIDEATASSSAETYPATRTDLSWLARHSRVVDWVVSVVLAVASIALVIVQVPQHALVSPIDEYVYIDYLDKVPTQLVVHRGEETGDYARSYLSCHGVRFIGFYPESFCTHWQAEDEARMPNAGKTTADIYTPIYFAVTWVIAQGLKIVGVQDLTEAGRYAGAVWLAPAAILLYLALRRMRVHAMVAGSLGLLMIGSLSAYWANTYISTDATALLAGAMMVFCFTMFVRGSRWAPWVLALSGMLATLAKVQNIMAVSAIALALFLWAVLEVIRGRRAEARPWRRLVSDRRVLSAVGTVIVSVAAAGAWMAIRSIIAVGPPPDQGVATPLTKYELLQETLKFFPGVAIGAYEPTKVGQEAQIASTLMTWVIVGGVLGLLAAAARGSVSEPLAVATFVAAVVCGPLLAIATVKLSGFYFHLPARYGTSLLPIFLACAGLLFTRSVWTRWLTPVVAIAGFAAVMSITG